MQLMYHFQILMEIKSQIGQYTYKYTPLQNLLLASPHAKPLQIVKRICKKEGKGLEATGDN